MDDGMKKNFFKTLIVKLNIHRAVKAKRKKDEQQQSDSSFSSVGETPTTIVPRRSARIQVSTQEYTYNQEFLDKVYRKYWSPENLPVVGCFAHVCEMVRENSIVKPDKVKLKATGEEYFRVVRRVVKPEANRITTDNGDNEISMFMHIDIYIRLSKKCEAYFHLYIYKSSLGARRSQPLFHRNDEGQNFYFEDDVYDPELYISSGRGIFAGRRFAKYEIIGILVGDITHQDQMSKSTYAIEYHADEDIKKTTPFRIDPVPFLNGFPYFGLHYANDARGDPEKSNNALVDVNLRVYAMEDVEPHAEIFWSYGSAYFKA